MSLKNNKNRNDLIKQYHNLVTKIVKREVIRMNLPTSIIEELTSAGYLGLVEAAERFDVNNNSSFKAWAYIRIKGAIIDCLREQHLSRKSYQYSKALKAANSLDENLETSKDIKLNLNQVLNHLAQGALAFQLSFNDISQNEIPTSISATPEEALTSKENKIEISSFFHTLNEKEMIIIKGYYIEDKSFTRIAIENPHLSKSWISKIHKKALDKLKDAMIKENYSAEY